MDDPEEWEEIEPGREVIWDESGKFQPGKVKLDPEIASQMGATRHKKAAKQDDDLEGLLSDANFSESNPPPTRIRLLAEKFASTGDIPAAREFIKLTHPAPSEAAPKPGERCRLCGHFGSVTIDLTNEAIEHILALIPAKGKIKEDNGAEKVAAR